jgi:hypothetical protein
MSIRASIAVAGAFALLGAIPAAQASFIAESEPNDTLATAQNVNASFSLDFEGTIHDQNHVNNSTTVPHVSIRAAATDTPTFDYYRFTVPSAGANGYFDIDNSGGTFDHEIAIWDAGGNLITGGSLAVGGDDCTFSNGVLVTCVVDPGSVINLEPYVHWTFANPGDYIIGVGIFSSVPGSGGWTSGTGAQNYILHIAIAQVSEPATLALLGIALAGLGFSRRKRS